MLFRSVGKEGAGLTYCGYRIEDLAQHATFEEVAYLLLEDALANHHELADFKKRLKRSRSLPEPLKQVLERIPKDAHPMDVLRTGVSMLGVLEPERDSDEDTQAGYLLTLLHGEKPSAEFRH